MVMVRVVGCGGGVGVDEGDGSGVVVVAADSRGVVVVFAACVWEEVDSVGVGDSSVVAVGAGLVGDGVGVASVSMSPRGEASGVRIGSSGNCSGSDASSRSVCRDDDVGRAAAAEADKTSGGECE